MRWLVTICGLVVLSGVNAMAQPTEALRFEGVWKLNGPAPNSRLEFQVNNDGAYMATYFHPLPSILSDVRLQADSFTAWYLDEFGSRVNLTAQLRGPELQMALAPDGRPPILLAGVRTAPDSVHTTSTQRVSGNFSKVPHGGTGEVTINGHTFVFGGQMDGNCVNVSVGKDGKGFAVNGCASVSATKTPPHAE